MSNGAVEGMSYKSEMKISKRNCEICNEGKQARLSFPDKGSRANEIPEIVHTDPCGPMEVK